jgi:hypothetical protein
MGKDSFAPGTFSQLLSKQTFDASGGERITRRIIIHNMVDLSPAPYLRTLHINFNVESLLTCL